jgi:hypothetical protein
MLVLGYSARKPGSFERLRLAQSGDSTKDDKQVDVDFPEQFMEERKTITIVWSRREEECFSERSSHRGVV